MGTVNVDLIWTLFFGVGSGVSAAVACRLICRQSARRRAAPPAAADPPDQEEAVILFADGLVVDATRRAADVLAATSLRSVAWASIQEALVRRFPDLPEAMPTGFSEYLADGATLRFEPDRDRIRLSIQEGTEGIQPTLTLADAHQERLDLVMRAIPNPIWQTDARGRLIWSNTAFDALCRSAADLKPGGLPFDLSPTPAAGKSQRERVSYTSGAGALHWYEVTTEKLDGETLHYATSIDSLVAAEMAQRNFVQTLTKTFAHLPIGLAVFDRNRQLVLFNPALVDLTRLPVDFLSARPNLLSFFDHMRENRIMPEPKNYANWRDQLAEVVSAAKNDRYCETWNLSSGLTYKITGRPHPDGAVAFLIEDISAEISLTRRFRSELELTQSVIDCFEDAVAVFSQLGVLTFSNAAFRELWHCDPDSAFAELTIMDATLDWQRACDPAPIWSELRDFVLTYRDRAAWDADLRLKDGRRLICTVEPVAAGSTMIRFGLLNKTRNARNMIAVETS